MSYYTYHCNTIFAFVNTFLKKTSKNCYFFRTFALLTSLNCHI